MPVIAADREILMLGPGAAGTLLAPHEFERAEFEEGYRYELIHGVLVVSPPPLEQERDPNEQLGHWLRSYGENHAQGNCLDATLHEHQIQIGDDRRRADRAIWVGLGRLPRAEDSPTIVAEFVSVGRRNLLRDYQEKRGEYLAIGVKEYWVFNRFNRTLSVFRAGEETSVYGDQDIYATPLLPGFELPLAQLFAFSSRWEAV